MTKKKGYVELLCEVLQRGNDDLAKDATEAGRVAVSRINTAIEAYLTDLGYAGSNDKADASYKLFLARQVEGRYGYWALVHLRSGRWGAVWSACLDDEDRCEMILCQEEEWFHAEPLFSEGEANPSYASKGDALKRIIGEINELNNEDAPNYEAFNRPHLKRAQLDLLDFDARTPGART